MAKGKTGGSVIEAAQLMYRPAGAQRCLLHIEHLQLSAGKFHAFIGPNGAGKSTLLRALSGDLTGMRSRVKINGMPLSAFSVSELAKLRAVLPQAVEVAFAVSVQNVIMLGREVHYGSEASRYDREVVTAMMQWLTVDTLANLDYQRLSGGEQHRAQIARTLAQLIAVPDESLAGKILFLDEPTNHLDIQHQYALMDILGQLKARGLTVICVLHDLSLALNYADSIVLLHEGLLAEHLSPAALVNSGRLDEIYGLGMNAHWSDGYQRYVIMPQR